MSDVRILGGGPAGSSAALAALKAGVAVEIAERSRFPKHKVCGEFLSPEIAPVLDRLGVFSGFNALGPHRIERMSLVFGSRVKSARLPEPAYGLSRYAFDHLLWSQAMARGARHVETLEPNVITTGRPASADGPRSRLFGFKAHYDGPVSDAVELYFLGRTYVGINCVEGGRTNVCGLAPEELLRSCNFEPEALMERSDAMIARLRPLSRRMKWLFTGPLSFGQRWSRTDAYLAGDALSFVDPFTGSGLLCAVLTGSLAGAHAALGRPVDDHLRACREAIGKPFLFSSALRAVARTNWAEHLVPFVPGRLLFRLTRPAAR